MRRPPCHARSLQGSRGRVESCPYRRALEDQHGLRRHQEALDEAGHRLPEPRIGLVERRGINRLLEGRVRETRNAAHEAPVDRERLVPNALIAEDPEQTVANGGQPFTVRRPDRKCAGRVLGLAHGTHADEGAGIVQKKRRLATADAQQDRTAAPGRPEVRRPACERRNARRDGPGSARLRYPSPATFEA